MTVQVQVPMIHHQNEGTKIHINPDHVTVTGHTKRKRTNGTNHSLQIGHSLLQKWRNLKNAKSV